MCYNHLVSFLMGHFLDIDRLQIFRYLKILSIQQQIPCDLFCGILAFLKDYLQSYISNQNRQLPFSNWYL